jgi:hypothetical protein
MNRSAYCWPTLRSCASIVSWKRVAFLSGMLFGQAALLGAQVIIKPDAGHEQKVARGSIIVLRGVAIGSKQRLIASVAPGNRLPVNLGEVTVSFNGVAAGLRSVGPSWIECVVPNSTPVGLVEVETHTPFDNTTAHFQVYVTDVLPALLATSFARGSGPIENPVTRSSSPFSIRTPENPTDDKRTRVILHGTGIRNMLAFRADVAPVVIEAAYSSARTLNLKVEAWGPSPTGEGVDDMTAILAPELDGVGVVRLSVVVGSLRSAPVQAVIRAGALPTIKSAAPRAVPPGAAVMLAGRGFPVSKGRDHRVMVAIVPKGLPGEEARTRPIGRIAEGALMFRMPPILMPDKSWYTGPASVCLVTDGVRACGPEIQVLPRLKSDRPLGSLLLSSIEANSSSAVQQLKEKGKGEAAEVLAGRTEATVQRLREIIRDLDEGRLAFWPLKKGDGTIRKIVVPISAIEDQESLLEAKRQEPKTQAKNSKAAGDQSCGLSGELTVVQDWNEYESFQAGIDDLSIAGQIVAPVLAIASCLGGAVAGPEGCLVAMDLAADAATVPELVLIAIYGANLASLADLETEDMFLSNIEVQPSYTFPSSAVPASTSITVQGQFVPLYTGAGATDLVIGNVAMQLALAWLPDGLEFEEDLSASTWGETLILNTSACGDACTELAQICPDCLVGFQNFVNDWFADFAGLIADNITAPAANNVNSVSANLGSLTLTVHDPSPSSAQLTLACRDGDSNVLAALASSTTTQISLLFLNDNLAVWQSDGVPGGSVPPATILVTVPAPSLPAPAGPTLVSPGNPTSPGQSVTSTPIFNFLPPANAASLALYISKPPYGPTNLVYDNSNISGSATSLTIGSGVLQSGIVYLWNMSASNASGTTYSTSQFYFEINSATASPAVTAFSGNGSTASSASQTVTVTGTGFVSGAVVAFGLPNGGGLSLVTSSQFLSFSANSITFSMSFNAAGTWSVVVTNPNNQSSNAFPFQVASPAETISAPGTPYGTTNGLISTEYDYFTSGASSNLGHPLQYQFTFGNGDLTSWLSPGAAAIEAWFSTGTFPVKVQARCAIHNLVLSLLSSALNVTISNPVETITTPLAPGGPTQVTTAAGYQFFWEGGSASSLGHVLQYQFFWGDGASSGWLPAGTYSAEHTWSSPGPENVTIQARCSIHNNVVSAVSPAYVVTAAGPGANVTLLASGLSNPTGLAADATSVYWTDTATGRVLKIASNGSASSPTTLATGMTNPAGIALDSTYVYFSEGGTGSTTIRYVPKSGGSVTTLVSGLTSVARIAADANNLYWTDPVGGTIRSMTKNGGTATVLATDPNSPTGIAIDSTNVYWTQMVKPGNVMAVPLTGGTVLTLGSPTNAPGVASDGTFVFWTQYAYTAGSVESNYIGPGAVPTVLVTNLNSPNDLALDSASVYWTELYSGNVKQMSIAGGAPITLASGLAEPTAIAQDASSVYWLENNYGAVTGGVLRKAPKQAPAPVARVVVATSVDGVVYYVDGTYYQNSPQVFYWVPGSTHTLQATSQQYRSGGGQYVFDSWSDGGAMTHTVSPTTSTTYTAIQDTQFSLAVTSGGNGTVNASATGYMNAGTSVSISATPNSGYAFVGWTGQGTGSYTGPINSSSVTMYGQIVEWALFSQCSYALASSSQGFTSAGGTASVSLTVLPGCTWQAVSNSAWITILSGAGPGDGTVSYSVGANSTGIPRTGTFSAGGLTFTVTQGSDTSCSYSVALPNPVFSSVGGLGSAAVAAPFGCSWAATVANATWLTIQAGGSGTANGIFSYAVAANTGSPRSGVITIAGQQFPITQSGPLAGGPFTFPPFRNVSALTGLYKTGLGNDGSLFLAETVSYGSGGLQLLKSTDGGVTFGAPVLITSSSIIDGSFDMTVDSSNGVHATWWADSVDNTADVYYSRSLDGGASFSAPQIVRTGNTYGGYTASGSSYPKIAADGVGNVYIAYGAGAESSTGGYNGSPIWVSRSVNDGATFQPEFFANTPDGNQYQVESIVAPSGSFFMLMHDVTNNDEYFYSCTSTTTPHIISRFNQVLHQGSQSALAVDTSGNPYAVYIDTSANPYGDVFFTKSSNGGMTWGGYSRVNDATNNNRNSPAIALDLTGGLHVVWEDQRSAAVYQAFYSYSGNGGATFSANVNLDADQPSDQFTLPLLAMDQSRSTLRVVATKDNNELVITSSVSSPILTIQSTHNGNFSQGQAGASYALTVTNAVGTASTTGIITVTESVPAGLILVSMAGTGWNCPTNATSCTRSDSLAAGMSYPAITATVNVAANAPPQVINSVSVAGGGAATASGSDVTNAVATTGAAAFSNLALNFGSQAVGVSAASQTVTVTNIGAATLNLINITISGDFSQTNNCGTVAASGNCAIMVKFTPTTTGFRTGVITVTDNGPNSPQVIHLSGVGVSGSAVVIVSLSALSVNFGAQTVNTTSAAKTVTLANSGNATLTVSSVTASSNFAQTNNCTAVAPAGTCTITVTFTPTVTGVLRGSVVIVDSATGSPQVIHLSGTGTATVPAIGLSNVSLDFGSQTTGTPSSPQTITVTNTGSATLTITGVTASGDFAASGCVTSLAAGATCTLSVTFTPTVAGARRGTVAITDNAAESPQVIQLFGTGM